MTERGYYLQPRGTWDDPLFKKADFTEREAWLWLNEHTCYKPTPWLNKSTLMTIERGQYATHYLSLREVWGWGPNRIKGFLNRLVDGYKIELQTDMGFLLITICNYNEIQSQEKQTDTELDTRTDTATDTKTDTKRNKSNKKTINIYTPDFELFWIAFDQKKSSKKKSAEKFHRAIESGSVTAEKIIAQAKAHAEDTPDKKYRPYAQTWLNGECWNSEYSATKKVTKPRAAIEEWKAVDTIIEKDKNRIHAFDLAREALTKNHGRQTYLSLLKPLSLCRLANDNTLVICAPTPFMSNQFEKKFLADFQILWNRYYPETLTVVAGGIHAKK